ncbi:MAG: lactonase family protein [Solirubrobacterales bacterium]
MSGVLGLPRWVAVAAALALATLGLGAAGAPAAAAAGQVYTLTNSPSGNAVKVFSRAGNGSLATAGEFATGGTGTGTGLGSQDALVLERRLLFAVNPGSDSISSFLVRRNELELIDTDPSGGDQPISLAADNGLLYVLNAGGAGNISGHTVSRHGALSPLVGSTRPLSGADTGPAQVSFDPDGEQLVVTEKNTNLIDTYEVDDDTGVASGPSPQASAGQTPFGFGFDKRGHLIVSEAFGGAPDASAVSSYELEDGVLDPITASAPTTETAACWIVVSENGRFTYTSNTGSGSISGYRIGHEGGLTLLDADGRTGITGPGPIDMALSHNGRFLYSLNSGDGTLSGFRVGAKGDLTTIGGAAGLPLSATGLVAR